MGNGRGERTGEGTAISNLHISLDPQLPTSPTWSFSQAQFDFSLYPLTSFTLLSDIPAPSVKIAFTLVVHRHTMPVTFDSLSVPLIP